MHFPTRKATFTRNALSYRFVSGTFDLFDVFQFHVSTALRIEFNKILNGEKKDVKKLYA